MKDGQTNRPAIRLLLVDDEARLVEAFRKKLSEEGASVLTAVSAEQALSLAKEETFDVAVLDIRLPDMEGVELLRRLKELQPELEVVMLTGYASVDTAIRSMKQGAYDYLTKPIKLLELSAVIARAFDTKSLRETNVILEERLHRAESTDEFIGQSGALKEVRRLISVVAPSATPVLITGETGTGKELVARAIHAMSLRARNPFVIVNSASLQETILESELFGHKKGAFTGADSDKIGLLEIANRGTFFVDEVGDMGATIQAKFLRVLETGAFRKVGDTREIRVDVRFVFATNKNLETEIEGGHFRKDLFYRLNTFAIPVPPLRQRKEDIPLLVDYFLRKFARGRAEKMLVGRALEALMEYSWPGNVRELANVLERAFLLAQSRQEIGLDEFPQNMLLRAESRQAGGDTARTRGEDALGLGLELVEREHIERVLKTVGGNKSKAARLLGISRKKLYSKIDEH